MSEQKHILGKISRSGSSISFEETEELASAFFHTGGGNKQVNRIYARRIVACVKACAEFETESLEQGNYPVDCTPMVIRISSLEKQRDELLAALREMLDLANLAPEDVPWHEYETIREGALEQASKAIAKVEAA